jgi:hypothetical protein
VEVHIKENPTSFRRFGAIWTPTVLVLDEGGVERWRIEGYLPRDEFRTDLELALARLSAVKKKWADAQARYQRVLDERPDAKRTPEAIYWRHVSEYSQTRDHASLGRAAQELKTRFPESQWAIRASIWE